MLLLLRKVGRWAEGVQEKKQKGDESGHGHAENKMLMTSVVTSAQVLWRDAGRAIQSA